MSVSTVWCESDTPHARLMKWRVSEALQLFYWDQVIASQLRRAAAVEFTHDVRGRLNGGRREGDWTKLWIVPNILRISLLVKTIGTNAITCTVELVGMGVMSLLLLAKKTQRNSIFCLFI